MPFEVPRGAELAERLASVLEVIYLIFNEGYAATAGEDWMRPALCEEALQARAHPGRAGAAGAGGPRPRGADGDPGVAAPGPDRAERRADPAARPEPRALGPASDPPRACGARAGRRRLGGAIGPLSAPGGARRLPCAGAHARTRRIGPGSRRSTACWPRSTPSPVVELNRAVAVSMAEGPAAGLASGRRGWRAEPSLEELPSAAERARRSARQARPAWRGGGRVRAGAAAMTRQCAGASIVARSRGECPPGGYRRLGDG